ncbi:hypothetical protein [Dictyobacter aurantiacus]|uniref:hypothetical protein n=1 Tax=Dictyobacter aurantiacus TaxID=1936993 RepID=UPI000F83CB74|nr:hypothetical protein [Dictyobacter aurantiacus]
MLILLIVFALIFIAPFLWLILTAFKSPADLDTFPITWFPDQLHWDNFGQALTLIDYCTTAALVNSALMIRKVPKMARLKRAAKHETSQILGMNL